MIGASRLAVGGKQPPRDLDPRGLGLLLPDQAARAIAIDLAELVAVDGGVERLWRAVARPRAGKRAQQDEQHDCREASKDNPNEHGRALASARSKGRLGIGKGVGRGKVLSGRED